MYRGRDHTFLICAYKESPYLEACIKSLLKQTVKSHILISTSTPCAYITTLAKKYKLSVMVNDGEKGIAHDWNYGYKRTETPLVTIAHQDDIYLPEFLEKSLDVINDSKKPLIAFTDYGELRNGKKVYNTNLLKIKRVLLFPLRFKIFKGSRWMRRRSLAFGSGICCPSVTYVKPNLPAQVFEAGYRSDVDWQAWERLSGLKGDFLYYRHPLMLHRIHEDSETSHIIADNQRSREDYEMFCRFWPKSVAKILAFFYSRGEKSNSL